MDFFDDQRDDLRNIRKEILMIQATQLMNDRERARFFGLPESTRIRENTKILNHDNFKCGHHVWIGEGAILDAQGGLEIDDYSQIGSYVMIWSHSSHKQAMSSETGISKDQIIYKKTTIGKNCFIAGHTVIAPGVSIGDNVIISPMSFVDRDLPDNSFYNSNKRLRDLEKTIEELKQEIESLKNGL